MAKATGSISKTFVWILLGLLILGLAGFGATSFSGTTRSVGSVGDSEIGLAAYSRALQNEMRAVTAQTGQPVTFQQAQAMGIPNRVLSQMVVSAALEHEAGELGLSVGDERLARDLRAIPAFHGSDGSFNREAYRFALQNAGLTEAEFEADLRDESAATLLQGAVLAGTALPDTYTDTLVSFVAETRDVTWARYTGEGLQTGLPEPDEDTLRAWYDSNIDRFTRPETRSITYAWITPAMLLDEVTLDEAALREAYEAQSSVFNRPERRLVERLVYPDEAAAETARTRVAEGAADFETLVDERGLDLADTDLGDVTRADLGDAAETVFAAGTGDVVGPAPTPLGPALFRVNAILAAQQTSFEEAQPQLRETLALDRARRVIEAQGQALDDALAAGETLEGLADTTDLRLGQIDWTPESEAEIAGYEAFRDAARRVEESDFPQIEELEDGGLFALRLDEIRPPEPEPFEAVAAEVRAGWEAEARVAQLVSDAEALRDRLAGGESFEAVGLSAQSESDLARTAFGAALPPVALEAAFTLDPGAVTVLPGEGAALILRLDAINAADLDGEEALSLSEALGEQAAQSVAQDLFRALASDIQTRAGVVIDQQAINAVNAGFQ